MPEFTGARGFLDTATMGLPPDDAVGELLAAVEEWRQGRASARGYDAWVERARAAFAGLIGVATARVAAGSQTSAFIGIVAASLPARARVLCAEGDFTSVLFPLLVQRERGVQVRSVALERLAQAVDSGTDLVAVSAVQSSDGRIADLDAIAAAAKAHNAATLVDITQACPWLPVDAGRFDYVACSAYKWLLSPRGTAFFAVAPERLDGLTPHLAGWYAGEDRWDSIYGEPLRLARDTRRLDVSPAWLSWVATAPTVEMLAGLEPEVLRRGPALAAALRSELGLPPSDSAIVSLSAPGARERLEQAGIRASIRGGAVRLSFHLYNDENDVDAVVTALRGAS